MRASLLSRSDSAWYIISLMTTSVDAAWAGGAAVTASMAVRVTVDASSAMKVRRCDLIIAPANGLAEKCRVSVQTRQPPEDVPIPRR